MYSIETKYEARLLAKHAEEKARMKIVLLEAHTFAADNTTENNLATVDVINQQSLFSPDSSRIYFKFGENYQSISLTQFGIQVEVTMGCDKADPSCYESVEYALQYIVTYYAYLTDYIYQNAGITISPPYRGERNIIAPSEPSIFFDDEKNLGEFEYE